MILRQRKHQEGVEVAQTTLVDSIRQFDAFAKVPEKYTKSSKIGGILSILSRLLIVYVIYVELQYYLDSRLIFKFVPDDDMDTKLRVNLDLTVASPCHAIGADILDSTNQFAFGELQEIDTWWELDEGQQAYFDYMRNLNTYLREQYHSIAHLIFKDLVTKIDTVTTYSLPERQQKPQRPFDACRIVGELQLNKVAGNFHITAGKSLHFPRGGHVHLMSFFDPGAQNFTHRINRFSFGRQTSGIVHPLEGDEFVTTEKAVSVHYYIDVVQTDIYSFLSHQKTFQYSVKENSRPIDHGKGSHGNPGIYFKYDVSALKVVIREDRENIASFLIRLCSVIAGIVVICGFINSILQAVLERIFGHLLPQYKELNGPRSNDHSLNLAGGGVRGTKPPVTAAATTGSFGKTNLLLANDMLHDNGTLAASQFIPFK